MKARLIFTVALLLMFVSADGQVGAPPGVFKDSVYSTIKVTTDVVYGSNKNYFKNNNIDTLKLDIYEPDSTVNYLRPVIIYLHAGGFTTGDKGENRAVKLGNHFARLGYVFSSINYRLGFNAFPDTVDNYQTVYQITQDAMSAVRFFRKHWLDYCIDTLTVFMIGSSSGGAICLTVPYWDQAEADAAFDTSPFGPLDQASGNEGHSSAVTAVVPCWAGMPDTSWLQNETEPAYLFHGVNDNVVPYVYGLSFNGLYLHGSYNIYQQLQFNGVESYLHPFVGAGHGVPVNSPQYDTLIWLTTDFFYNHLSPLSGVKSCGFVADPVNAKQGNLKLHQHGPFSDPILINYSNDVIQAQLDWLSLEGKLLGTESAELSPGGHLILKPELNEKGLYFLRLRYGASEQIFKVVLGS
ncbi:MAG: alpha/beta hydrolase [Chitinophagales bacterium]|nr:alpha/beta hydrolase [Chitinophagales bacterium]MDW8427485.1 alpha/beta hydrolase [Chitinophagales bacterium]